MLGNDNIVYHMLQSSSWVVLDDTMILPSRQGATTHTHTHTHTHTQIKCFFFKLSNIFVLYILPVRHALRVQAKTPPAAHMLTKEKISF